ncbi:HNH endonuclease signature motif containing protein [Streptomyces sp. NPDC051907]|uniref:HNH endonuclease n=1 Tax=Streptomyces sp. NPDC051907 TaxID=3155284 RepID=UPI0034400C44
MRTRCLDCRAFATHAGRCAEHHRAYESGRSVQSHRKRREAIARGNNAAARLRKAVRKAVQGTCARCLGTYLPSAVDIDHIKPLAKGGEDVDANVQVLCKTCHKVKTAEDFGYNSVPF